VGRRPGTAGIARRRGLGWAAGGRRKEGGGREADRRAPVVSATGKREGEGVSWAGAERVDGPPGPKGWPVLISFFFFFFFKLHFQIIFHLKFNSNFFKLFSRIL
jgi:hypothetical protein